MRRNRSSFTFPDFSLRRLLLQARAARGSPSINGNRCDIEKGASGTSKSEKSSTSTSTTNKVRKFIYLRFIDFLRGVKKYLMKVFHSLNKSQRSSLCRIENSFEFVMRKN